VPSLAVGAALALPSPDGRSFGARIDAVRTGRELSRVFEDFADQVPLGKRLLAGWNPMRRPRSGGACSSSPTGTRDARCRTRSSRGSR
jgi:hypothetical protein